MRKPAPPLLAIFRTRLQGELLARVYLRVDDGPLSVSELARELAEPPSTVHREVARLVQAGLLTEHKVGRSRLLTVPADELVTRPLTDLLAVSFGPLPVLRGLLETSTTSTRPTCTDPGPRGTGANPVPPRTTSTCS